MNSCAFPSQSPEDKEKHVITPALPHVGQGNYICSSGMNKPEDFFFKSPEMHFNIEVQMLTLLCLPHYFPLPCFQPVVLEKMKARFLWKLPQFVVSQNWKENEWEWGLVQFNAVKHNVLKPPDNLKHVTSVNLSTVPCFCLFSMWYVFSTGFW